MERVKTMAEKLGERGRQVVMRFYTWDKAITPLAELLQEGEDFYPINQVPTDFKRASEQVADKNAQLLFGLFAKITSKTRNIASGEGGGSSYKPYVYDKRDPSSSKVIGLKMERGGFRRRLATLVLSLPSDEPVLILSIQNTSLPDSTPDLVFKANKEDITVIRTAQQVKEEEKWLDEGFDRYIERVLVEAQTIYPNLAL